MSWTPSEDLNVLAVPPRVHLSRSPEALRDVVAQLNPEKSRRYQRRDVDGNGTAETFCNFFLRDALAGLGIQLPKMRANEMFDYFSRSTDWRAVQSYDAAVAASAGFPTVAAWKNPSGGPGHVGLVMPTIRGQNGIRLAQAGRTNFSNGTVGQGFGGYPVSYWTHD